LEARLGPSFQFQDNCWVASDCTAYYFKDWSSKVQEVESFLKCV
jgi:hypothetical protein